MSATPGDFQPPQEFDEYKLLKPLGRGRTGHVWLAQDTLLDRAVAVKFIPAPDAVWLSRFLVEARAAARVQHPNVASLYRVGQVGDYAYLVSEYVGGQSLDRVQGPLPQDRLVEIAEALARGLAAAHRGGVLHRDIKPGNAVVDAKGEAKLVDFGLARIIGARSDEPADAMLAGSPVGTPYFIAPEIWRGEPATVRSDLWSLGALLYELAAGRGPHRDVELAQLPRVLQEREARKLSEVAAVDPMIGAAIDRCLRRDPRERWASVDELADALEQARPERRGELPAGNPYRGLEAFDARHRRLFFGRRRDLRAVLDRLRREPLILVTGDSGVGKSSLCLAGIAPAVGEGQLGDGRAWRTVRFVPGRRPLGALAAALAPILEMDEVPLEEHLRTAPDRVSRGLRLRLGNSGGLLLYADQLEELCTVSPPAEAEPAARALGELCDELPGVKLVASARSDFLTRLAGLPGLGARIPRSLHLLRALGREEIREVIVAPARVTGARFESEALVEQLVDSTAKTDSALPLLQFALAELWQARDPASQTITAEALQRIGGVSGALSRHADAVVDSLLPAQRQAARRILLRLVTLEGTRVRRPREEMAADADGAAALEALVRGRLLVAREAEGATLVEIAHEALLSGWATLSRWLAEATEVREAQARVEAAAADWQRQGRKRSLLWDAARLADGARVPAEQLTPREREFLEASRAGTRRQRLLRRALAAGFLLSLLAVYGGVRLRAYLERESEIAAASSRAAALLHDALAARTRWDAQRQRAFALFDGKKRAEGERAWAQALAARDAMDRAFAEAALAHEQLASLGPRSPQVRGQLADLLVERALTAREEGRPREAAELEARLRIHDEGGARAARLTGPATLRLTTQPPGAQATLIAGNAAPGAQAVPPRALGQTPLGPVEAPAGSWTLSLKLPDRPEVRLPVLASAGEQLSLEVALPARVPEGFAYVPAGRFLFGAAAEESVREFFNTPPLHAVQTGAYLIARTETTYADFMPFLDALPPVEREKRAPHVGANGLNGQLDLRRVEGAWQLTIDLGGKPQQLREGEPLRLPARAERREQDWRRLPVAGVSMDDARAYAAWLSSSGRVPGARLCTEHEWERAARGADAREFPHGDRLAPADADFDLTYGKAGPAFGPDEAGAHPASRSPFGVDDLAGNVWEWVTSSVNEGEAVARGGSYYSAANTCRSTNRELPEPSFRALIVGVRICADPSP